jgi:tetratricopeptide (TPR) repeat protein
MMVDVKHDHSFRVPRPDFSVAYGTPNACNQCHKDKSNNWAADTVAQWYGPNRRQESHFVKAIDAGRRGLPNAEQGLTDVITHLEMPAIARATALNLLPRYLTPYSFPTLEPSLTDDDALVRREAVRALAPLTTRDQIRLAAPRLTDPSRSVRIEAARLLAGTPPNLLQDLQKAALDRAISELIASEMASAERPESHMSLALLYSRMGRTNYVETELETALRLDPNFVPAMVKLANLYRAQNRDDEGRRWLEKAIAVAPNAAEPYYALALLKIRQKQFGDVIGLLGKAAALDPDNLGYSYVYAVTLNSSGHTDQAIEVLQQAHQRRPADRQMLIGLIAFEREKANLPAAATYARQLVELAPNDPAALTTLSELMAANDPKTFEYWLIQGDADSKLGHLPNARTAFQKGMDLALAKVAGEPEPGYTHACVAYFAARLGERDRAEQQIKQALELSAGDERIIRRAVFTYEALGERARTIEVLSQATPRFLYELNRQPELPDLRDDPRFQQLLSKTQTAAK